MQFVFDETELMEFIKHTNIILYSDYHDLSSFKSPAKISKAIGDALQERIKSRTYSADPDIERL